jgi:hypothetical protein
MPKEETELFVLRETNQVIIKDIVLYKLRYLQMEFNVASLF